MKISVITACFNSENTIRDAIESVLSQDYEEVEYIVVDGASTDGTLKIINDYSERISRIISEPDKGIYDALNKGIEVATGDLVGFLHSDDLFADDTVLRLVAESAEGEDAVYGDLNYVSARDTAHIVRRWKSKNFTPELLEQGWMPPHPSLYLRRNIYRDLGGFDLSFQIASDYESILRYFSQPGFKARYIPQVLVAMRLGGVSNGTLHGILRKMREDYAALRKNNISSPFGALVWKNFSKIPQFFVR